MPDVQRSEWLENYKDEHDIDGTELNGGVDGSAEHGFNENTLGSRPVDPSHPNS